jgi:hypothetical protein
LDSIGIGMGGVWRTRSGSIPASPTSRRSIPNASGRRRTNVRTTAALVERSSYAAEVPSGQKALLCRCPRECGADAGCSLEVGLTGVGDTRGGCSATAQRRRARRREGRR